ncbi:hypothetical protein HMPREF0908_0438 [Selenomonas flueggei ATCC 43531]|uniref:Uncharacterized protein n=1 Tax=Selenomonas flueggei ATCC 43531 TaxID=638302 RepID=C4V1Z1_9FIRM|nr:hypothetical protein HMPREF0908_0438 [Selenomonas flueggei ATCC 43531]
MTYEFISFVKFYAVCSIANAALPDHRQSSVFPSDFSPFFHQKYRTPHQKKSDVGFF